MKSKAKQILVIPRKLHQKHKGQKLVPMSAGKLAAQAAHASLEAYLIAVIDYPDAVKMWHEEGVTKIVLAVDDEDALLTLYRELISAGFAPALIQDEGLTEIRPGSYTALGIGPIKSELIDPITGKLPPY